MCLQHSVWLFFNTCLLFAELVNGCLFSGHAILRRALVQALEKLCGCELELGSADPLSLLLGELVERLEEGESDVSHSLRSDEYFQLLQSLLTASVARMSHLRSRSTYPWFLWHAYLFVTPDGAEGGVSLTTDSFLHRLLYQVYVRLRIHQSREHSESDEDRVLRYVNR